MTKLFVLFLMFAVIIPISGQHRKDANYYFYEANKMQKAKNIDSIRFIKIIDYYSKSLSLNTKYWQAYRNRAKVYIILKKFNNAVKDLNSAIKYTSYKLNPDLTLMLGQCYYELKDYQNAIKNYTLSLSFMGDKGFALMCRAKSYWKIGNKKQACSDYQSAIKENAEYKKELYFLKCN
jgi:tetratricopeptide (TPR) repeat protein